MHPTAPLLLALLACATACGAPSGEEPSAATTASGGEKTRSAAVGSWAIDRVGLGVAVDAAVAKLERAMPAKLEGVPESDRAMARTVGSFAVGALTSVRDLEMRIEVKSDGTFTLDGVDPSGKTPESGAGTWVDEKGFVVFTVTQKNGAAFDGRATPMRYGWKDADTLMMSVPNLDVGIPLKRR